MMTLSYDVDTVFKGLQNYLRLEEVATSQGCVSQLSIILSHDLLCLKLELAGVKGSKGKLKVVMRDGSLPPWMCLRHKTVSVW